MPVGKVRKYGWTPDHPDHRDFQANFAKASLGLPAIVDLRPNCPPVYDQGAIGSCTAQAVSGALWFTAFEQAVGAKFPASPSRLFVYWWTRYIEGNVTRDSGASLRGTMKSIVRYGYPNESVWPYITDKFKQKPNKAAISEAAKRLMKTAYYASVRQTEFDIKGALVSQNPVVFGFSVFESFESAEVARTGVVPIPRPTEQMLGGHAVALVGYDDARRAFLVRNSWGAKWGMAGYCWMPYAMVLDSAHAADFWTINWVAKDAV